MAGIEQSGRGFELLAFSLVCQLLSSHDGTRLPFIVVWQNKRPAKNGNRSSGASTPRNGMHAHACSLVANWSHIMHIFQAHLHFPAEENRPLHTPHTVFPPSVTSTVRNTATGPYHSRRRRRSLSAHARAALPSTRFHEPAYESYIIIILAVLKQN